MEETPTFKIDEVLTKIDEVPKVREILDLNCHGVSVFPVGNPSEVSVGDEFRRAGGVTVVNRAGSIRIKTTINVCHNDKPQDYCAPEGGVTSYTVEITGSNLIRQLLNGGKLLQIDLPTVHDVITVDIPALAAIKEYAKFCGVVK